MRRLQVCSSGKRVVHRSSCRSVLQVALQRCRQAALTRTSPIRAAADRLRRDLSPPFRDIATAGRRCRPTCAGPPTDHSASTTQSGRLALRSNSGPTNAPGREVKARLLPAHVVGQAWRKEPRALRPALGATSCFIPNRSLANRLDAPMRQVPFVAPAVHPSTTHMAVGADRPVEVQTTSSAPARARRVHPDPAAHHRSASEQVYSALFHAPMALPRTMAPSKRGSGAPACAIPARLVRLADREGQFSSNAGRPAQMASRDFNQRGQRGRCRSRASPPRAPYDGIWLSSTIFASRSNQQSENSSAMRGQAAVTAEHQQVRRIAWWRTTVRSS